ncbi:hypothetical protein TanjilG_28011 [Lupinus angustifolius]|uniref:Uncharacterized protein n=1 Tax=Lupinus angustifolius TaxID=3871 RepID=A0A4P1RGG7_LUPAN|nr:PREDICTED: RNA-binding protein FUS-like [Lupinus angustifolius]OIW10260.1 hypothetical protein TanjilG_28011 [Lupinus angustifolius]
MAQQQQQQNRQDQFSNQDRDDDSGKNDQFGTGGATDPAVTQYTYYESTVATGYGAPPPVTGVAAAGAYALPNYGTYDPTLYATTGAAGFNSGGGGQWGQDASAGGDDGGGGGGQSGRDASAGGGGGGAGGGNKGRDQK